MMNASLRATLALGLALTAAAPAGARQIRAGTTVPAGVPTNAGGGTPTGFGNVSPGNFGGGFNGNGAIGINSPFYGNSGYGGNYGYGGLGFNTVGYGYGYGTGGIGTGFTPNYGGFNYYGTYGGIGLNVGMSPYDQEAMKEYEYAQMSSQYNLQNARAAQAYQAANLTQQQAISAALTNRERMYGTPGNSAGYEPRYNVATASTRPYPRQLASRGRNRARGTPDLLPREKVLDADGRILWPTSLPRDPDLGSMRQGVDTAFHDVVDDFRKRNRGSVRDTVNARDKLYAFGNLAEQKLQDEKREADIPQFQVFLASLDRALVGMASAAPSGMADRTRPDSAPKSAGSVLLDSVEKDRPASKDARPAPAPAPADANAPRSADQPPPAPAPDRARPAAAGDVRPDGAPKSAGDVLKDTSRVDGDRKP